MPQPANESSRFGHQINHHASSTGAAIFSAVCSLPAMGIAIGLNGTIVDANRSRRSIRRLDRSLKASSVAQIGRQLHAVGITHKRRTTSVSIGSSGLTGGSNVLDQLAERTNDLTTVTISGAEHDQW